MDSMEQLEESILRSSPQEFNKNEEDSTKKDIQLLNNEEVEILENNTVSVDFSARISDYDNTIIRKNPNLDEMKVIAVFNNGKQSHLHFSLSEKSKHTIADLIKQINGVISNEIKSIYPVNDPVNNFSYIVNLSKNVKKRARNSKFSKKICNVSAIKETEILDLTDDDDSMELDDVELIQDHVSNSSEENPSHKPICAGFSQTKKFSQDFQRNVNIVVRYPFYPRKYETTVTVDDFNCLNEENYLNDVIIEFYLKYLFLEKLSLKNQKRIHMFNTYFYSRLIKPRKLKNKKTTQAERRYLEVKRWTKSVDIFSKDFIIIPVCLQSHWMLAIVCYPALILKKTKRTQLSPSATDFPCILLFDSLTSIYRSKTRQVTNVIKSYLKCEYASRKNSEEVFAEDNIRVIYPKVPQQDNMTDCGLYLLQFVESFFEEFVSKKIFGLHLKDLKDWFEIDLINRKRNDLKRLLVKSAILYNIQEKRS